MSPVKPLLASFAPIPFPKGHIGGAALLFLLLTVQVVLSQSGLGWVALTAKAAATGLLSANEGSTGLVETPRSPGETST